MLKPDFGSASFPMRSVSSEALPIPPATTFKRVRFSRTLVTREIEIPSRRCKLQLSILTEELSNRVRQLRRQVQTEQALVDLQARVEEALREENAVYDNSTERSILQLKKEIEAQKDTKELLNDSIDRMKMDMLRLRGLPASRVKTEVVQPVRSLARMLWSTMKAETIMTGSPPRM